MFTSIAAWDMHSYIPAAKYVRMYMLFYCFAAIQMWTFARFLPLVIGHLIPFGDEHWENFLRLLEIMDILFSRTVLSEDCGYLEALISDHHLCFKELYPSVNITMKMHSMIHLPRLSLE